jgi:hypothetical protein
MANTKLIISHFGSHVDFVIFFSFYNKIERETRHKMTSAEIKLLVGYILETNMEDFCINNSFFKMDSCFLTSKLQKK